MQMTIAEAKEWFAISRSVRRSVEALHMCERCGAVLDRMDHECVELDRRTEQASVGPVLIESRWDAYDCDGGM